MEHHTVFVQQLFKVETVATFFQRRRQGQQLFGIEPSYDLPWFAPSAVLLGVVALALVIIWRRLGRAEVLVG